MFNDEKIRNAAIVTFDLYLTQHKLRKTPERFAILEKVFATAGHFFIDSLYSDMEADGYHVSRATVYNTIKLLIEAGLVRRHRMGRQSAQYEKVTGPANHHHLVCTQCGKIKEVKNPEIDALLASRRYGAFHPSYTDLYIYGVCSRCARKTKKKVKS